MSGVHGVSLELIEKHYSNGHVKSEIAEYCRGRWVALEGGALGSRVFLRYWRDGRPLRIDKPDDVEDLLRQFKGVKPRTIYGSVNIYGRLSSRIDLDDKGNIILASPVWDIDGELEKWRDIIEVARIIVDELERLGIAKSVYVKWSGEGAHVHVHERCFSSEVLSKYHPLDVAYSLVEYVLERCKDRILEVASRSTELKVENEIDLKRVFTAPLSLHRRRDLCCVCFKPEAIDSFEVEWANPLEFKHDPSWKNYVEGEGDEAAIKAMEAIGGYKGWHGVIEVRPRTVLEAPKPIEAKQPGKLGIIEQYSMLGLRGMLERLHLEDLQEWASQLLLRGRSRRGRRLFKLEMKLPLYLKVDGS